MSVALYTSDPAFIVRWTGEKLGVTFDEGAKGIGIVDAESGLGLAGVVYSNWRALPGRPAYMCDASIYSTSPRWATRTVLRAVFHYPFVQCRLRRLQTICEVADAKVRAFNERLGFTQEGVLRDAWDLGGDAIVWSMLPHECPWLKESDHAELSRRAA